MGLGLSGLRLGLGQRGGGGSAAFTPVSLFAGGENGVFLDASDATTIFTDTAGTTPATTGQNVARMNDLSGNGNDLTQSTVADRPLVVAPSGAVGLQFDGSTDTLVSAANLDLSGTNAVTVCIVVTQNSTTAGWPINHNSLNDGSFSIRTGTNVEYYGRGTVERFRTGYTGTVPRTMVLTQIVNIGGPILRGRKDGGELLPHESSLGTGNFASAQFRIGGRAIVSNNRFNGIIYAALVIDRVLTEAEIKQVEAWMATKAPGAQVTPDADMDAFLLIGQSNMVGKAAYDSGTYYPADVRQWMQYDRLGLAANPLDHFLPDAGTMGLAMQFAIDYEAANPGRSVAFIPSAKAGTGFGPGDWNDGQTYYEAAVSRANAFFAAHPGATLKGILWHQGESDSDNLAYANAYATNLDALIAGLRADITAASATTPFVCGDMVPTLTYTYASTVSAALAATPDRVSNAAFVESTSLTDGGDSLHFDAASLRTLGTRYYYAVAGLIGSPDVYVDDVFQHSDVVYLGS